MNCPYCGKTMQKGDLLSGKPIIWSQEKKKGFYLPLEEGDIAVSKGFWKGCFAESWYCAGCKKLITEVNEEQ